MGKASIGLRAVVLASAAAMALAACGGGSSGNSSNNSSGSGDKPTKGGTLTFLTLEDQFQDLDPQRNYTGENLAFDGGYSMVGPFYWDRYRSGFSDSDWRSPMPE